MDQVRFTYDDQGLLTLNKKSNIASISLVIHLNTSKKPTKMTRR